MKYLKNLLIWGDQGVNAIAGGNPDCTISACSYTFSCSSKFWGLMLRMIDATFYPIDGPKHCQQSFENDSGEDYTDGNYLRKSLICICVVLFCVVMYLPIKLVGSFIRG